MMKSTFDNHAHHKMINYERIWRSSSPWSRVSLESTRTMVAISISQRQHFHLMIPRSPLSSSATEDLPPIILRTKIAKTTQNLALIHKNLHLILQSDCLTISRRQRKQIYQMMQHTKRRQRVRRQTMATSIRVQIPWQAKRR